MSRLERQIDMYSSIAVQLHRPYPKLAEMLTKMCQYGEYRSIAYEATVRN